MDVGHHDVAGARQVDVVRRMLRVAFGVDRAAQRLVEGELIRLVQRHLAVAGEIRRAAEAGDELVREVRGANAIRLLRRFGLGGSLAISNPIQTDIGRNPVQETRRVARVEVPPALDHADEHVLPRIERFLFVPQQLTASPQDHRSVLVTERGDVQLRHASVARPTV